MKKLDDIVDGWKEYREHVNRLEWDEYFILQAFLVSIRSLDAQTQCGCVITKPDNTIIATGYNSFIGGVDDSILPNLRPAKYPFMIHAEHNAILSCAKNGNSCEGCIVYVTGKPCNNCFQFMHQAGISAVVYYEDHPIHMVANQEQENTFEILENLSEMKMFGVSYGKDFSDKISRIKSCR